MRGFARLTLDEACQRGCPPRPSRPPDVSNPIADFQRAESPAAPSPSARGQSLRPGHPTQGYLPIELDKYLSLLDWTGRELRAGKARHHPRLAIADPGATGLETRGLGRDGPALWPLVQASSRPRGFADSRRGTRGGSLVPGSETCRGSRFGSRPLHPNRLTSQSSAALMSKDRAPPVLPRAQQRSHRSA